LEYYSVKNIRPEQGDAGGLLIGLNWCVANVSDRTGAAVDGLKNDCL